MKTPEPPVSRPVQRLNERLATLRRLGEQAVGECRNADGQTSHAAARRYLTLHPPEKTASHLERLCGLLDVNGRELLFEGALARFDLAPVYLENRANDPYARAQALIRAGDDLAARITERGLIRAAPAPGKVSSAADFTPKPTAGRTEENV